MRRIDETHPNELGNEVIVTNDELQIGEKPGHDQTWSAVKHARRESSHRFVGRLHHGVVAIPALETGRRSFGDYKNEAQWPHVQVYVEFTSLKSKRKCFVNCR